ncbi:MAG: hypothetical protein M1814_003943 [Vezdaea aestivalis]|nr:MAG: hypothetical protein M1814_003943 [Vezdaea aestivalis]
MFLFGIDSYNPNARVQIIPSFSDIIDVRDDPTKNVKIVCGDAFFVKEGEGRWRNTITGSLVKSPTDVDQLMCDSETLAFASKHAYIGLCPLAWSRIHLIGSRRDRVHGVDSHLDDFLESLPAVLIHEMLHVGSTYGPQGIMRIDDQPAVNSRQQERTGELAYGYARCVNLAIYDPKPTKRCFTNADSLTALAMGVYMHKNDWSLGIAYPLPTP